MDFYILSGIDHFSPGSVKNPVYQQPAKKAADMRPECDTRCIGGKHEGAGPAQQLADKPDSNVNNGRYRNKKWYNNYGYKRKDIAFREHKHIGCHDS